MPTGSRDRRASGDQSTYEHEFADFIRLLADDLSNAPDDALADMRTLAQAWINQTGRVQTEGSVRDE